MKIRSKLLALNVVVLVGFAALTLATVLSVGRLHDLNGLDRRGRELKNEFLLFLLQGKELGVTGNLEDSLRTWLVQYEKFGKLYEEFVGAKAFEGIPEGNQKIEDFSFVWQTTQANVEKLTEKVESLIQKHNDGGTSFVVGLSMGFDRYGDMDFISPLSAVNSLLSSLNDLVAASLSAIVEAVSVKAAAAESFLVNVSLGLAIGVSVVTFVVLVLFARSLTRRIMGIGRSMDSLTKRDFTVRLPTGAKDELGAIAAAINGFLGDFARVIEGVKSISSEAAELKNEVSSATIESSASVTQMTANIASIGGKVRDLVEHLNNSNQAVRSIAEGVNALMGRVENQSLLIGRSTASIEEMNASMQSVAGIAAQRESAARNLVTVTKNGGAMIDETNQMIREIVQDIQEITEIIAIIDGISEMTNLLSMNAAIEAA
ncbi:MAG: methyl-accepting chemotaxis protein, partial [Bacillota bacterium]|nr:methyl-accepting chemotaxis protein [Bacillota bacterium]